MALPGPRTSPTVKSTAAMNQRALRRWELRLGPIQVAMVVGIVLGSLVGTYFLGVWTGQQAGFAMASEKNLNSSPRQEIALNMLDNAPESQTEPVPDIYSKLSDAGSKTEGMESRSADVPKLGVIEEKEVNPINKAQREEGAPPPFAEAQATSQGTLGTSVDLAKLKNEGSARVLGEKSALTHPSNLVRSTSESGLTEDQKTLGALLQGQGAKTAAPVELAKKEVTPTGAGLKSSSPIIVVTAAPTPPRISTPKATPTPRPTVAKVEPAPKGGALAKGWYAQVAAPRSSDEASALARTLRASGFPVGIERAEVKGDFYYRVVVGPEESRPQAERLIDQLKREPSLKGQPFLRQVK